ncbi:MAG: type IV pilus modification PilV family protein [Bacteriovoracaceae bacterium]
MKKNNKVNESSPFKLNQAGFTITEVIIASAILAGTSLFIMKGMGIVSQNITRAKTYEVGMTVSSSLLSTMVSNAKNYQVNFSSKTEGDILGNVQEMPFVWNQQGVVTTPDKCSDCPGRYGVFIKTEAGYNTLNELVIKIYHPQFEGSKTRIYTRTVGSF